MSRNARLPIIHSVGRWTSGCASTAPRPDMLAPSYALIHVCCRSEGGVRCEGGNEPRIDFKPSFVCNGDG